MALPQLSTASLDVHTAAYADRVGHMVSFKLCDEGIQGVAGRGLFIEALSGIQRDDVDVSQETYKAGS